MRKPTNRKIETVTLMKIKSKQKDQNRTNHLLCNASWNSIDSFASWFATLNSNVNESDRVTVYVSTMSSLLHVCDASFGGIRSVSDVRCSFVDSSTTVHSELRANPCAGSGPRGPNCGNTIGTPPRIAFGGVKSALSLMNSTSWPSFVHEQTCAPWSVRTTLSLPFGPINSTASNPLYFTLETRCICWLLLKIRKIANKQTTNENLNQSMFCFVFETLFFFIDIFILLCSATKKYWREEGNFVFHHVLFCRCFFFVKFFNAFSQDIFKNK